MSRGDQFSKGESVKPQEPTPATSSGDQLTPTARTIAARVIERYRFELGCCKDLFLALLSEAVTWVDSVQQAPTAHVAQEHRVDITRVSRGLSDVLSQVADMDGFDESDAKSILEKITQVPALAETLGCKVADAYALLGEILESAGDHDKASDLKLSAIAARSALRLFDTEKHQEAPICVLDLLAGCSLLRCTIKSDVALSVPVAVTSHPLAASPQTAAFAVSIALHCVHVTMEGLFDPCLQSVVVSKEASVVDILREMHSDREDSSDLPIVALKALAAEISPLRTYELQTGAMVSFLVPQICAYFVNEITATLDSALENYQRDFDTLEIKVRSIIRHTQEGYEVGLRVTLPIKNDLVTPQQDTVDLLDELEAHSDQIDPSPVTLRVPSDDPFPQDQITAIIPRSFFDAGHSFPDEGSLEDLALVYATLPFAPKLLDDGTTLFFSPYTTSEDDSREVLISAFRAATLTKERPLGEVISTLSNYLTDCASGLERAPRPAVLSTHIHTFQGLGSWLADPQIQAALKQLSDLVVIDRLYLNELALHPRIGSAENGATVLKALHDALLLHKEPLQAFYRPHISVLQPRTNDRAADNDSADALAFYLTASIDELCGVGSLPLDGDVPQVRIFPTSISQKFGYLLDAIDDSQTVIEDIRRRADPSAPVSWSYLLQHTLHEYGFRLLSDNLVQSLFNRRVTLPGPIPSHQVAEILYTAIALEPEQFGNLGQTTVYSPLDLRTKRERNLS